MQPVGADGQTALEFITLVARHAAEGRGRKAQLIAFAAVRRINDRVHQQRRNDFDILRGDALLRQQRLPRAAKCSAHDRSLFSTERHGALRWMGRKHHPNARLHNVVPAGGKSSSVPMRETSMASCVMYE